MIDLYTWSTPNGRKISIALEELDLAYRVIPVNIGAKEQFAEDFLAISPNNKIPCIRDSDNGRTLFESGAILLYLVDKTGQLGGDDHWQMVQWLMLQMSSIGPMFGQTHYFHRYNPGKAPHAEERFVSETHRLYGLLNRQLANREFLAGSYSVADIAIFPWVARWPWHSVDWSRYPDLARWYKTIVGRDAVQRGYNVPASDQKLLLPGEDVDA